MKQLGNEDASMYFYVDNTIKVCEKIENAQLIEARDYYSNVKNKSGMKMITRVSMMLSDRFHMVKMIHIKISKKRE
jgi:hypothetical protein